MLSGLFGIPVDPDFFRVVGKTYGRGVVKSPLLSKVLSFLMKELLLKWKINLDEISEDDVFSLLLRELREQIDLAKTV